MRVAICDDEGTDRVLVCHLLQERMKKRQETLEIVSFDSGEDLAEQYENGSAQYDLIFMDIFMKYRNGIETMKRIRCYDKKVGVIFVTASPDYAIESYEVRAHGYLLKPVVLENLEMALNRFMEDRYPRVRQSLLMINGSSGKRIAYDDIIYIESRRMNLRVVCRDEAEYSIRRKLDDVQKELPESRFLRCNQSFIVNMDYVKEAGTDFAMENGDRIPIKVREKKKIRDQYFAYIRKQGWNIIG